MTLIIAIKCKDGLIFASDGQATSPSSGGPIRQRYKKIYKIEDLLFGAAGTLGTIQRCAEEIKMFGRQISEGGLNTMIEERTSDGKVARVSVRDKIRQLILSINMQELERHKAFHGSGEGAPLTNILIVFYDHGEKKFRIWHILPDGGEEFLEELGYGCIGIGDTFAHAFIKDYYSPDLSIEKGKALAYRIIKDAIEIGAFGLGEPIDIWTIKIVNEKPEIRNLVNSEILALHDTYVVWKDLERRIFTENIHP
jgi:20S proteasome alpha/beta subunit